MGGIITDDKGFWPRELLTLEVMSRLPYSHPILWQESVLMEPDGSQMTSEYSEDMD